MEIGLVVVWFRRKDGKGRESYCLEVRHTWYWFQICVDWLCGCSQIISAFLIICFLCELRRLLSRFLSVVISAETATKLAFISHLRTGQMYGLVLCPPPPTHAHLQNKTGPRWSSVPCRRRCSQQCSSHHWSCSTLHFAFHLLIITVRATQIKTSNDHGSWCFLVCINSFRESSRLSATQGM